VTNTTTEQLALVRSVDPETCSPEEQEIIATGAAVLQLDILRENEKKLQTRLDSARRHLFVGTLSIHFIAIGILHYLAPQLNPGLIGITIVTVLCLLGRKYVVNPQLKMLRDNQNKQDESLDRLLAEQQKK
jgi:NhaP-type Na+/H+ or K+/H+ antiporter